MTQNEIQNIICRDLAQPGMDTESVEHVIARKNLSIFSVFKLTQAD